MGWAQGTARNFITILLIAAGGAIIYGLPYFRYDYYDAYLEVYHLTNTQMGVFGSIFGVFGIDPLLVRRLPGRPGQHPPAACTVSLVGTGLGGFLHLLPLTFPMLVGLYAFWGFTSLFAFWPACVKAVRVLSSPESTRVSHSAGSRAAAA